MQEAHQRKYLNDKQRYYSRASAYKASQAGAADTHRIPKFSDAVDGGQYGQHVPGKKSILEALKRELKRRQPMYGVLVFRQNFALNAIGSSSIRQ